MGIQIAVAESQPAVTYNQIHMTKLEIVQPIFSDNAAVPLYQVIINFRHYGVTDGIRYYQTEEVQRVAIDDFVSAAMTAAAGGDMTLLNALQSIELAVAGIIADQTGAQTAIA
jgi:hypothetical protein